MTKETQTGDPPADAPNRSGPAPPKRGALPTPRSEVERAKPYVPPTAYVPATADAPAIADAADGPDLGTDPEPDPKTPLS